MTFVKHSVHRVKVYLYYQTPHPVVVETDHRWDSGGVSNRTPPPNSAGSESAISGSEDVVKPESPLHAGER